MTAASTAVPIGLGLAASSKKDDALAEEAPKNLEKEFVVGVGEDRGTAGGLGIVRFVALRERLGDADAEGLVLLRPVFGLDAERGNNSLNAFKCSTP